MHISRLLVLSSSLLLLAACTTPLPKSLEEVRVGMDKASVLDMVGNPKRVQRQGTTDVWTYVFYKDERPFEKDIRFQEGQVILVSEARSFDAQAVSETNRFNQEYEQLIKASKPQTSRKQQAEKTRARP